MFSGTCRSEKRERGQGSLATCPEEDSASWNGQQKQISHMAVHILGTTRRAQVIGQRWLSQSQRQSECKESWNRMVQSQEDRCAWVTLFNSVEWISTLTRFIFAPYEQDCTVPLQRWKSKFWKYIPTLTGSQNTVPKYHLFYSLWSNLRTRYLIFHCNCYTV